MTDEYMSTVMGWNEVQIGGEMRLRWSERQVRDYVLSTGNVSCQDRRSMWIWSRLPETRVWLSIEQVLMAI